MDGHGAASVTSAPGAIVVTCTSPEGRIAFPASDMFCLDTHRSSGRLVVANYTISLAFAAEVHGRGPCCSRSSAECYCVASKHVQLPRRAGAIRVDAEQVLSGDLFTARSRLAGSGVYMSGEGGTGALVRGLCRWPVGVALVRFAYLLTGESPPARSGPLAWRRRRWSPPRCRMRRARTGGQLTDGDRRVDEAFKTYARRPSGFLQTHRLLTGKSAFSAGG